MNEYTSLLVPTDGSPCARKAGQHAMHIAAASQATVHALSIIDPREYTTGSVGDVSDIVTHQQSTLTSRAEEAVDAVASSAHPNVEIHRHVEDGIPFEVIERIVSRHDIDLVAMGTHGRTGIQRLLLGSVAENTLRTVEPPVLTVQETAPRTRYEDILIPTDGSKYADTAVDHALILAQLFDSNIHALYAGSSSQNDHLTDVASRVNATLGKEPLLQTIEQEPHTAITDYAATADIDLITMGTHGRTGLRRQLLGSVTERTIRTSDIPVLSVRYQDPG